MLHLYDNSAIEDLRQMSIVFRGNFTKDRGFAKLEIDNEHGKGIIRSYIISSGLSVRTYNIIFNKDFKFKRNETATDPLILVNCFKGHFLHKFEEEEKFAKISAPESTVIKIVADEKSVIILPEGTNLKLSVIFLSKPNEEKKSVDEQSFLKETIKELSNYPLSKDSNRFTLSSNTDILPHLKLLIDTDVSTLTNRLLVQSAVLRIMASQLNKLKKFINDNHLNTNKLDSTDLNKILELGSYIEQNLHANNTVKSLATHISMSTAKLQSGFKKVFGKTVNEFIREVRLEKSRCLIETSDLNISEICYEVGLSSRSYFSKSFSELYGIFPSDYLKQVRNADNVIFEISYNSKAIDSLSEKDIENMINKSRVNNKSENITGCLVYLDHTFYQVIEGSMASVINLYKKIKEDPRHNSIVTMTKSWRNNRNYNNWDMAFFSEKFKNVDPVDKKKIEYLESNIARIKENVPVPSQKYWSKIDVLLRSYKNA